MTANLTTAIPRCPHFGQCGGCQLQNIAYEAQLNHKRDKLAQILQTANIAAPAIETHASAPYEYRNRIRLRLERADNTLRLGYNRADCNDFLPIITCPIAAPLLWLSAEALLSIATANRETEAWLDATAQVELFTNDAADRVQLTLLCNGPRKTPQPATFARFGQALTAAAPHITSIAAVTYDPTHRAHRPHARFLRSCRTDLPRERRNLLDHARRLLPGEPLSAASTRLTRHRRPQRPARVRSLRRRRSLLPHAGAILRPGHRRRSQSNRCH